MNEIMSDLTYHNLSGKCENIIQASYVKIEKNMGQWMIEATV